MRRAHDAGEAIGLARGIWFGALAWAAIGTALLVVRFYLLPH